MVRDVIIPIGGAHPPESDNQCKLCKRKVPSYQLTYCPRCKKLYCKSCITEDLQEGERLICLNCARRYITPKISACKSKYMPLTLFLSRKASWKRWQKLAFSEIEGIIAADLPAISQKIEEWWTNTRSVQARAWISIGWYVEEVNLKEKTVIFTRPEVITKEKPAKLTKSSSPLSLPEYKPIKKSAPSLTRIAIANARLANISHRKSSMKKYRGKFRPKPAYEKRLWSSDEKP